MVQVSPDDVAHLLLVSAEEHLRMLPGPMPLSSADGVPVESRAWRLPPRNEQGDPNDLRQRGWAVVAPEGPDGDRMLEAIRSLIELRAEEQGLFINVLRVPAGQPSREALRAFILGNKSLRGYNLLLGDFDQVPLELQTLLSTNSLVGRLAFDKLADYAAYSAKLVHAERNLSRFVPRGIVLAVQDGTPATAHGEKTLLTPILHLAQNGPARSLHISERNAHSKEAFLKLGAEPRPTVLFSLGCGEGPPPLGGWRDEARQRARQGALSLRQEHLTADDLADKPFLSDGVWWLSSSFSAGTPSLSRYDRLLAKHPEWANEKKLRRPSERPFVAALAKAALANYRGPLAVIGHTDLVWSYDFEDYSRGEPRRPSHYARALTSLLEGNRIGAAFSVLTSFLEDISDELDAVDHANHHDSTRRGYLWMLQQELASLMLLGDPAARLNVPPDDPPAKQTIGHPEVSPHLSSTAGDQPQVSPEVFAPDRLRKLVISLFAEPEQLGLFLWGMPEGKELLLEMPGSGSMALHASELVDLLSRYGATKEFVAALLDEFPRQRENILRVATLFEFPASELVSDRRISPHKRLADLLCDLFDSPKDLQFALQIADHGRLVTEIAWGRPMRDVARQVVDAFETRNELDSLLQALRESNPTQIDMLSEVATLYGISHDDEPSAPPHPDEAATVPEQPISAPTSDSMQIADLVARAEQQLGDLAFPEQSGNLEIAAGPVFSPLTGAASEELPLVERREEQNGAGAAAEEKAEKPAEVHAEAGGEEDLSADRESTWDGATVTLTIDNGEVRLHHGLVLDGGGEPAWSRAVAVDWTQDHFVDHDEQPCSLDKALALLPMQWERRQVEAFGRTLATLIFGDPVPGPVAELLKVPDGERRRLVLVLDQANFRVPWEYLRIGEYFVAEQRLSIIRHVPSSQGAKRLKIAPIKDIVFVYANPGPTARRFDGDAHRKPITDAIVAMGASMSPVDQCTDEELENRLTRVRGDVFHFLGHGAEGQTFTEAALIVHDSKDRTRSIKCGAERVALWVRDQPRTLVVLGACYSGGSPKERPIAGVGWRIVDASGTPVVAMQMEVPQEFSTAFAARFYDELARAGFDVEVAVFMARRAIHKGRHAFGIPVLLADARGLAHVGVPELRATEKPGWATFDVRARLVADDARAAWRENPLISPEIARQADKIIEVDAGKEPRREYPAPPSSREEVEETIVELLRTIRDDKDRERLAAAGTSRPVVAPAPTRPATIHTLDECGLDLRITPERCDAAIDNVQADLSLPADVVPRIVAELLAGKHVLLTGPVGTGKTSLARAVAQELGYAVHLETASADWTRFEVQGGFWPIPDPNDKSRMLFDFRAGVFLEAVLANWEQIADTDAAITWKRVAGPGGALGVWLILDELNRADMDRALGGIFAALETRRLRVPVAGAQGGSVELPIPEDFRVIATINASDRHFLFRLSDALKRRFAFVHVAVADDWEAEWKILRERVRAPANLDTDDLRRFVALVRVLHPLGTALVQAALRFLVAGHKYAAKIPPGDRTGQAIAGSILPGLEEMRRESLVVLRDWAASSGPTALERSLLLALPQDCATLTPMFAALAALPGELSPHFKEGDDKSPALADREALAAWVARRVARQGDPLGIIVTALSELVGSAPVN